MLELKLSELLIGLMIFVRCTAIVVLFPVFSQRGVPPATKIGLALFLTVLLFPLVQRPSAELPDQVLPLLLVLGKEALVGLAIGFASVLIFAGIQLGGAVAGMQMGFGIVRMMDPQTSEQTSMIGQVQQLLAILFFLIIDGHHFLLKALSHSFDAIPLFGGRLSNVSVLKILDMGASLFEIAAKIGAPVIVALLLTSVAMGIIARTVPQMNIFIVGFPLKIAVGMLAITMSLPIFLMVFKKLFAQFQTNFLGLIKLM